MEHKSRMALPDHDTMTPHTTLSARITCWPPAIMTILRMPGMNAMRYMVSGRLLRFHAASDAPNKIISGADQANAARWQRCEKASTSTMFIIRNKLVKVDEPAA